MAKTSVRKRLTTKKNRPKCGSKKNKENCPIEIPSTTLQNATSSCSALASTKQQNEVTGSCPAQVLLENRLSPPPASPPVSPVTPKSFQDHDTSRCSALASTKKNNEVNCAHPAPVSLENCWSPPPASPPVSPVTPKGSHELFDCLISPTTGVLRSRNNISFCADDFAEGTVVHSTSTPLKGLQSGINYEWCTASFSAEACGEESSFPDATPCSGDLSFGQPTPNLEKTDSRVFTVSSMSIIDATPTPSGIYPRPLQEKVQVSNIGPSPSLSQNPVLTVEDLLKTQLPTCWQVNTNENKTAIICRMQASPDSWANIQRCAYISEDGTVQLDVHCQAMSLDHQIWQDLPCRVGLTNRESVDEFVKYVLEVVNVFRSYVMCIGIPESKYSKLAAKHSGLMFDGNLFKEARYAETYRSKTCLMLLPTKTTTTKFCSSCSAIRGPLLRRFSRAKDPLQTPPTKANHRWLDSTQKTRRLAKLSKAICNSKKREDYHRAKAADLIERFGVHVEERNSGDFRDILDKHYKSMKITEENKLQRIFIEQQLKAARVNGPRGMKWHPAMIRLALQIHMMSPAAYEAIRSTGFIRLPSSRTLFNYSHISDVQQGINGRALKEVVDQLKDYPWDHYRRYFVLLMDEMYISKNLVYSRATGELSGFVHIDKVGQEVAALELQMDMDDGLNQYAKNESSAAALRRQHRKEVETFGGVIPDISSTVLAFMAVGVANGIKQVVASYGGKGTSPASLSFKTWDVVSVLERNHVHVLGLVCDGHATNRKFIKMHEPLTKLKSGTVFDTRNRAYPLRPFYFFSDVPHLLKTLRNNFYNSGAGRKSKWLKKDGETISWKTIVDLYESEKDNEVRLAYKLNAQVVYLNSYSQMKVSYATRVFSKTVANAITEVFKHDPKPVTVDFITKVNDFFDCLNGASLLHGIHKRNPNLNPYRRQYKKNKEGASIIKEDVRFKLLKDFSEYLLEWKKSAEDERFHISDETIVGVEMTVHSFIACVNFMLDKGANFLLARVFCQDPLEQHFGKHRGACGGNRNPNLKTYQRNENKFVILKGLPFKRRGGNTKVVRAEGWADRVCAPLLKRAKSQARVGRVNIVRKKLVPNAALNK